MPIKIKNDLPARAVLENEHIFVMTERRALTQDIRPLQILILNLMPTKIETETQILRCLSNTPLQLEIELLQMESHTAKNVSEEHMITFYQTFPQIKHKWYDGLIITGAPVELMDFEDVEYWDERLLFYLSKMYAGQIKAGESYSILKKCIQVSVLTNTGTASIRRRLTDLPRYRITMDTKLSDILPANPNASHDITVRAHMPTMIKNEKIRQEVARHLPAQERTIKIPKSYT